VRKKLCNYVKKCNECEVEYKKKHKHKCFKYHCKKCKRNFKEQPHYCYIKPLKESNIIEEDSINKIIVTYDIESTQINKEHRPNLLIQKTKCDQCSGSTDNTNCKVCLIENEEPYYFYDNCVKKFVDYLFIKLAKKAEDNKSLIYAFAHNARGYDGQFILREIWNRYFEKVSVIMRGRKILMIQCGNIKLLDSLNYFLLPLSKLPKCLGLDINVKKGEFPHLFNLPENYNYIGTIPEQKYFGINYLI